MFFSTFLTSLILNSGPKFRSHSSFPETSLCKSSTTCFTKRGLQTHMGDSSQGPCVCAEISYLPPPLQHQGHSNAFASRSGAEEICSSLDKANFDCKMAWEIPVPQPSAERVSPGKSTAACGSSAAWAEPSSHGSGRRGIRVDNFPQGHGGGGGETIPQFRTTKSLPHPSRKV